jgi:AcrR family transcriptional regulator
MAYRRTPQIQARLDAQRESILRAAADLLAERGYSACSMATVAQHAGVAAGTVYNHFDGKAGLFAELFRAMAAREVEAVQEAASTGTTFERLTAVVETFAGRALKAPKRAYALLAEPVDPAIDQLRLEFRVAFRDVLAEAILEGVRRGELPPQEHTVVAAALVGAISEALIGPLSSGNEDADTVPTLVSLVCRAVGGRPDADA